MSGASYLGCVQWLSAPLGSEYLTCLAPRVMCNDYFNELFYPGGAFQLNVAATWGMRTRARTAQTIEFQNWTEAFHTLPVVELATLAGDDVGFWRDWVEHSTDDDYWAKINVRNQFHEIAVPALEMSGSFDLYAKDAFKNFNDLRERGKTPETRHGKLIVGPWPHQLSNCTCTGDVDFGANSMVDLDELELRWFDHWLKGKENSILEEPPIRLFIMGINEWRDENEWPLARTDWQRWYLHSGGGANTAVGDGKLTTDAPTDERPDEFRYDPRYPVQTVGGNNCCSPHIVPWGPYDQRAVEMRHDVLCFTSAMSNSKVDRLNCHGRHRLALSSWVVMEHVLLHPNDSDRDNEHDYKYYNGGFWMTYDDKKEELHKLESFGILGARVAVRRYSITSCCWRLIQPPRSQCTTAKVAE